MLQVIIVDDEKPARDILKVFLEKIDGVSVSGCFCNAAEAIESMKFADPDIAFLDIEMHQTSGLELAKKMRRLNEDIEIVFVTAFDQYALDAFQVNALGYLTKPISQEDVRQAVARIVRCKGTSFVTPSLVTGPRVCCFGKLSVLAANGRFPIKWRTAKAEELFAYMLQNLEQEVPKWRIAEALWPECHIEKVDIYLHTTIYRMKKALSSVNISFDFKFSNGCYWMSLRDIFIDFKEFDLILNNFPEISEDSIPNFERIFALYVDGYLEEKSYAWSLAKQKEYADKFNTLAMSMAKYYMARNNAVSAENVLGKLLEKFPFNETAHELLLKSFFSRKDRNSFIEHYIIVQRIFKEELNLEPNDTMQALYHSLLC